MLDHALQLIRSKTEVVPSVAVVLGSGLGGLADRIEADAVLPYDQIPGWSSASASGHRGELIMGHLESVPLVAMAGRLHRYEGWTHPQVVYPIRVMASLGAKRLIVSNAAGGVNPQLRIGEIVVIADHINFIPDCFPPPQTETSGLLAQTETSGLLAQTETSGLLERRGEIYDPSMRRIAMQAAIDQGFDAREGTYLATLGPSYETRSEYRMMRRMGADVVGMSTVPEVLTALEEKMRVLGISMVSNVATPDTATSTNHEEVLEAGKVAEVKMEAIVRAVLRNTSGS